MLYANNSMPLLTRDAVPLKIRRLVGIRRRENPLTGSSRATPLTLHNIDTQNGTQYKRTATGVGHGSSHCWPKTKLTHSRIVCSYVAALVDTTGMTDGKGPLSNKAIVACPTRTALALCHSYASQREVAMPWGTEMEKVTRTGGEGIYSMGA